MKLAPHIVEALAHERLDLLSESERAEIEALRASDPEKLERVIARERESSHAFTRALPRALSRSEDEIDVDALVRTALARAEHATERASARTLAIGATLGVMLAAISGSLAMALHFRGDGSDEGALEPLHRAAALARAGVTLSLVTTRALDGFPGGAASVALLLLGLVSGLVWLTRRLDRPLRSLGGGATLALLLAATLVPTSAHAYVLEGTLPADAHVHVDVDRAPRSVALTQAAASAGLGLVYSLEDDPPVTLHVADAPLSEVLDALLPNGASVHATAHLLNVAPARPPSVVPPPPPAIPPLPALPARPVELHDVLTFGGDAHVAPDQEVRDVITMGGDATIEGRSYGSVVTMGGDADVAGVVVGDVVTMGGDIRVRDRGVVHGRLDSLGGHVQVDDQRGASAITSSAPPLAMGARGGARGHELEDEEDSLVGALLRYSLLFLLSILFLGLAPERFARVQRAIVERPVRTLATGMLGVIGGAVLMIALCVSLIGIPVAIVLAIATPLACATALASIVPVVGAMLPTKRLEGRPVARLAAGALALFVVTRIPFVGGLAIVIALLAGLGALVLTRGGGREADSAGL